MYLLSCKIANEHRGGFLHCEHDIFAEEDVGRENAFRYAGDH